MGASRHEEWVAETIRVGNRAVREAQARNRALGIPNRYLVGGRLVSDVPGAVPRRGSAEGDEPRA